MKIEILGTGCPKCALLEEQAKKAVANKNLQVQIVKVININDIIEYGVMATPALVLDGEVKCYGRVPEIREIEMWLEQ